MRAEVRKAKKQHHQRLMGKRNVVAVWVGKKKSGGVTTEIDAVIVGVKKKEPLSRLATQDVIPSALQVDSKAVPTDVVETGVIKAFQSRTERIRPVPGGVSVGHVAITAGTLGGWVRKGGQRLMLSNNHVLAASNDGQVGDPILQPGVHDGGIAPNDRIATLKEFVQIHFLGVPSECQLSNMAVKAANWLCALLGRGTRFSTYVEISNLVDAALGLPLDPSLIEPSTLGEAGQVFLKGFTNLEMGTPVRKYGRTTGFTTGQVVGLDASVQVQYGEAQIALFDQQIVIDPPGFSAPGDSGSLILVTHDGVDAMVGALLFAGSDEITLVNPIGFVVQLLGLEGTA